MLWHWTGGSRLAEGVCETLRARSLSVHWVLDPDGRLVLCCDPLLCVAYHAGDANCWTEGCEIVGGPAKDFTAAQYARIGELADSRPYPRRIFRPGVDDVRTFSGHLEHRDVSARKIDAGGRVGAFLRARWGPA
jgi:N-acetyl-anhydromuramyl-L-alanine amidase AmpD